MKAKMVRFSIRGLVEVPERYRAFGLDDLDEVGWG